MTLEERRRGDRKHWIVWIVQT